MRRTADDCWVHSTCAFWHPELKFLDQNVFNAARSAVHVSEKRRALVCRVCGPGSPRGVFFGKSRPFERRKAARPKHRHPLKEVKEESTAPSVNDTSL